MMLLFSYDLCLPSCGCGTLGGRLCWIALVRCSILGEYYDAWMTGTGERGYFLSVVGTGQDR